MKEISHHQNVPICHDRAEPLISYELQPGQTLDNRFFITETISHSSKATVFKATDLKTKTTVAVPVPCMDFANDPSFYSSFQLEETIGLRLNHSYILKFIPEDEGEHRSRPYIATEYLRGYTLAHLLHSIRPLPEKDALRFASRICNALAYMHDNGITYRDLNQRNIMICYDGSLRIMEFGLAKSGKGKQSTLAGFFPAAGTTDYMAPEQIRGKQGNERTDIYSLGAMLYEMVVGVTPFDEEYLIEVMNARVTCDPIAPRKRNPHATPQVEEIILRAMERKPDKHYEGCSDENGTGQSAGNRSADRTLRPAQITGIVDVKRKYFPLELTGDSCFVACPWLAVMVDQAT